MKLLWVLLLAFSLTGCALFETDNSIPPMALKEIQAKTSVKTLWSTRVGVGTNEEYLYLVPAEYDNAIFVADATGEITKVAPEDGKKIWSVNLDLPVSAGVGKGAGFIFVGTSQGEVVALQPDNGQIAWRSRVSSEILAAPQASSDKVIVHTADGNVFGLDTASGVIVWTYKGNPPALTLRGSSPPLLLADHVALGFSNGRIAVLDTRNGQKVWEHTLSLPQGRSELQRLVDVNGAVLEDNGILYGVSYQGKLAAVDVRGNKPLWEHTMSSYRSLSADSKAIYVTDADGIVWALDRKKGETLWQEEQLQRRKLSAPSVWGDYIVVGDYEGYLHVLSRETGELFGRERIDSSALDAQPMTDSDAIYVLSVNGELSKVVIE